MRVFARTEPNLNWYAEQICRTRTNPIRTTTLWSGFSSVRHIRRL